MSRLPRWIQFMAAGVMALAGVMLEGGSRPSEAQGPGQGGGAARLERAEAALAEARFEEAREALQAWWAGGEGGRDRTELQHALWLRARLTVDPDAAELLYRRLVVEFPGGGWSDQALLRLAAGATARNESATARRYLEILVRDYPASPFRVAARANLARLAAEPGDAAPSPAAAAAAGDSADGSDAAVTPPPSPSPAPVRDPGNFPVPVEPAPSPPPAAEAPFALQFGAFGERARAESVAAELRLAGIDTRVVQVDGSPLFRVRSGGFSSRDAAEVRARDLEARGFELLISADRAQEREPDPA